MQVSYDDLYQLISKYIVSEENQSLIYRAYDLANRLHVYHCETLLTNTQPT